MAHDGNGGKNHYRRETELNFEEHMCGGGKSRKLVQAFEGLEHRTQGRYPRGGSAGSRDEVKGQIQDLVLQGKELGLQPI